MKQTKTSKYTRMLNTNLIFKLNQNS